MNFYSIHERHFTPDQTNSWYKEEKNRQSPTQLLSTTLIIIKLLGIYHILYTIIFYMKL